MWFEVSDTVGCFFCLFLTHCFLQRWLSKLDNSNFNRIKVEKMKEKLVDFIFEVYEKSTTSAENNELAKDPK